MWFGTRGLRCEVTFSEGMGLEPWVPKSGGKVCKVVGGWPFCGGRYDRVGLL